MVRLSIKTGLILTYLVLLMTGTLLVTTSAASDFQISQDVIRPNIWDWDYYGRANESQPFTVWANATDNEGGDGIRNVTINISGPNVTVNEAMIFNGTYYERDIEAFPNPGTFLMTVIAYDMNNNSRSGRDITIIVEGDVEPPVDPILTLPVVVTTSILLGVIVIMFALFYDQQKVESSEDPITTDLTS